MGVAPGEKHPCHNHVSESKKSAAYLLGRISPLLPEPDGPVKDSVREDDATTYTTQSRELKRESAQHKDGSALVMKFRILCRAASSASVQMTLARLAVDAKDLLPDDAMSLLAGVRRLEQCSGGYA